MGGQTLLLAQFALPRPFATPGGFRVGLLLRLLTGLRDLLGAARPDRLGRGCG